MSFLSEIYSKILGTNSKKTEQACSNSSTGFIEDFDKEDGFVLYTAEQNKRCKQTDSTPGAANYKSYENFQQSCPYPAAGSPSYMMTGAKIAPEKRNTTFLTVSDIPVQLSKQLQTMLLINQGSADVLRSSSPNFEQYHYDFTLERDIVSSFERASVG